MTDDIDEESLKEAAKKDPKSKGYNNKNSRKNLKQYQKHVVPEMMDDEDAAEEEAQVTAITVGRKISVELVKKLMPQRGVLTAAERKRYMGIVEQYLADFKSEDPTAADIDDIFEIAESDIMKTRLLKASRDNPETLVQIQSALEKTYKRKQTAKENLSNRRVDRKDARSSQEINIVDLVVSYDLTLQHAEEERVSALLAQEDATRSRLKEVLEEDV